MTDRILTTVLLVFIWTASLWPQSQMSSGDIKGTIKDATGGVLPDASVSAIDIETGVERRVRVDAAGKYRFLSLPPGNYALRAQQSGFAIYTRKPVPLTVGQSLELDFILTPAGAELEVLVQEDTPVIEPERTQQSDTITMERISNLPINQRNFLSFSLLTPGVTESTSLSSFSLPQMPASGLSFLGQNGRSNSVTVDGVDNNDNAVSGVRSTISQEAVREFQINRAAFAAEFGRASGGLVNIVSRSGANNRHGDVFAFIRNQSLDARNPFAFGPESGSIDPPFSRQQSGFTFSGPLRKDRTFHFLSYEGLRQRESRFVTFMENPRFFQPTASQSALIAGLGAHPSQQVRAFAPVLTSVLTTSSQTFPDTVNTLLANSGVFPYRNNDNTASLRLDHSLSESSRLFSRLSFTDTDTTGGLLGGLNAPSRGANFAVQDLAAVLGLTHYPGSTRVNEFRFQFASRKFNALPADRYGPEITINGVAALGRNFFLPSTRTEKRYQWLDNFTVVQGRHQIKFGADFNYLPFDTSTEVFLGGRFIFGEQIPLSSVIDKLRGPGTSAGLADALTQAGRSDLVGNLTAPVTSIQSFNFGLPLAYQQGFGNPSAELTNKLLSGYIQDNFTVSPALTMNFGLRYDVEFQPTPIHRDTNNWGPRFGFSYSPSKKTVIRGGYGVYYTPIFEAVAFVGRVLNGQQISQVYVPITGLPQIGIHATSAEVWGLARNAGIFGNRTIRESDIAPLGLVPGTTPPVLLTADEGLVNPYSQQFSFGIDRELPGRLNLSVNYLGNHASKVIRSRNVNLQQVGMNAYGPVFGPIDPRILQNNKVESSGNSIYHGLVVSATKRYTRYYQLQVSYTLSKTIDDTTDFLTDLQPANQLDLRGERSLSSLDRRQRLVVSAVLESPLDPSLGWGRFLGDLKVAPIVTLSSGQPFNLLLGFDANGDTQANTDRPRFAGRNTGQGPGYANVDLRVSRGIRVARDGKARLEAVFEAFNLFNRVNYNGVNNIVGTMTLDDYRVTGHRELAPAEPLGFTSASDPRQIQLGLKFKF